MQNVRSWLILRFLWRFRAEFLRGSWVQKKQFVSHCARWLRRRAPGGSREDKAFERNLFSHLMRASESDCGHFVFMFSGTASFQEHRGNRPIRLTRELIGRRIPVLFSYWRWSAADPIPAQPNQDLFQSPIDLTVKYMRQIAEWDFGSKKKIFVITFPHISCARAVLTFSLCGWSTVYDVRDNWREFHRVGQAKWYNENIERYICNSADIVSAVSRPLQQRIQQFLRQGDAVLSPNALDTRYLSQGIQVRPADGRRVAGYVGHLSAGWFDWESLNWLAESEPSWTFEIIGHSMPPEVRLAENVKYLGPKDFTQIATIARGWRVALIPFKTGLLSDSVDPIKIYEYLAMGLPVVSFRMPQIHDYPYVFIANSRQEFRLNLSRALNVALEPERISAFLAKNRWEDRVNQLLDWGWTTQTQDVRSIGRQPSPPS